jgi:molecular chaperone DnaK
VHAKDLATGKEQSMQITGGSALGKDDINRMVQEAEAHAEEDRKRREAIELRNEADNLVFRTEKLISENADKIDDATKAPVEEAIAEVKTALEGTDDDAVKSAVDKLNTTAAQLGSAMYAAAQASQESTDGSSAGADTNGSSTNGTSADDDDVVDAEVIDDDSNAGSAR